MAKKSRKEGEKVEIRVEGEDLDELEEILEVLRQRTKQNVTHEDCLRFLISHYKKDTYVLYIPEEFKRKKEEWEKKNEKEIDNNAFLALLIDTFKV